LRAAPFDFDWGTEVTVKLIAYNLYGDSADSQLGQGAIIITYPDAPLNVREDVDFRSQTSIFLRWDQGISNGGTPIIDYDIYFDQSVLNYVKVTTTSYNFYLMEGLTMGYTYRFKLTARNSYGYSQDQSIEATILCATVPDPPLNVATVTQNPSDIYVHWTGAVNGGLSILEYKIFFMKRDYTYEEEKINCDGSEPDIVTGNSCTVPFHTLKAYPFELVPGEYVNVKIIAVNDYGESIFSEIGTGGQIQALPDAPQNLKNDESITEAGIIAIMWDEGASNGGTPVIDYRLWYAESNSFSWTELDNLYVPNARTVTGLTEGITYKFMV
jgi:hypothetical protein